MKVIPTTISDVLILEPKVFGDERGCFFESFNDRVFRELTGRGHVTFVQDNHSRSGKNTLRGLALSDPPATRKAGSVVAGEAFDVAVDIRPSLPSFRQWVGARLSAEKQKAAMIPEGFAHGFLALTEVAEVLYKTTDYWAPEYERSIGWNDPDIDIDWPIQGEPVLSAKDRAGRPIHLAETFP